MISQTYLSLYSSRKKKGTLPPARFVSVAMKVNPALGPSQEILDDYKETGDWSEYVPRFIEKIAGTPEAWEQMDELIDLALTQDVVLMCYESEKNFGDHCHRFLLLNMIEDRAKSRGLSLVVQRENYLLPGVPKVEKKQLSGQTVLAAFL